jgi:hypothetical protein
MQEEHCIKKWPEFKPIISVSTTKYFLVIRVVSTKPGLLATDRNLQTTVIDLQVST